MDQILAQLREFLVQYSLRQRLIMGVVIVGFISAIISMILWANRTEYDLLYANLDPASAGAIVEDLRNSKIKYRLENGGTTIYAPADQVAELRLQHVQSGHMKDAVSGYELFEKNNMGMTTFMQRLNLRRALEGELMRTINQFAEVKMSRVHLVVPENRLFDDDEAGSASVVLHMIPGRSLNTNQISGIAALVANSVEGIEDKDVVVMDAKGNVLIEGKEDNEVMGSVNNQHDLRLSLEDKLEKKVTDLVEGVVGRNNSVVRVSTELDFDQIERTLEEVDPDKVVLLSEKRLTESSISTIDSSDFNVEDVTMNYALTKKVEHFVSNTGGIKKLSVAVLVNGNYRITEDEDGEKQAEYLPRDAEELIQIERLVKSAVGFDEARGDIVEVENMKFNEIVMPEEQGYLGQEMNQDFWIQLITYGLLGLGIVLGFLLLKGLLKTSVSNLSFASFAPPGVLPETNLPDTLPEGKEGKKEETIPEVELSEDLYMRKLSPEARAKLKAKDRMTNEVVQYAEQNPENTSKLLRSWLTQPVK